MNCGDVLDGKYRILQILGKGGSSTVYLGENIRLGTLWAIKEISKSRGTSTDFLVEPNILKRLNHPSLPRIFDILDRDTGLCLIMDYIEGVALDKELTRVGCFKEESVLRWALEICDVLQYLHRQEPNPIIYRDMKPSNIMLCGDGSLRLIDFGIAREYKSSCETDTVYIGTRGYAAPEQYGTGQTSVASDLYSLGITLRHLITGQGPGEAVTAEQGRQVGHLSLRARTILDRCTRIDPMERYQNAQELAEDIRRILEPGNEEEQKQDSAPFPSVGSRERARMIGYKKLVLTVWDNTEFACELAYTAAKLTHFNIMLADLDLLSPKADLYLNIQKFPVTAIGNGRSRQSGLDLVMEAAARGCLSQEILTGSMVKRRELKNLSVLTGSYRLESYEYFDDRGLAVLLEKAYQCFDLTILAVNRSIYDAYTVLSLLKSDLNLAAVHGNVDILREYNSYLAFLKEKQQLPAGKTRFVAFEYDSGTHLSKTALDEATGRNLLGVVTASRRRSRCRNTRVPYVKRMDRYNLQEYRALLLKLNLVPRRTLGEVLQQWAGRIGSRTGRIWRRFAGGRSGENAHRRNPSQDAA